MNTSATSISPREAAYRAVLASLKGEAFVSDVAFIGKANASDPAYAPRSQLVCAVAGRYDTRLYGRGWERRRGHRHALRAHLASARSAYGTNDAS